MGCGASTEKQVSNEPMAKSQVAPLKVDTGKSVIPQGNQEEPVSPVDVNAPKATVIFVLGGPGSGKTLLCDKLIADNPDFVRYSLVELLGIERNKQTKIAQEVRELIAKNALIPAKVSMKVLKENMKAAGWANKKFLLEGIPKNQKNLEAFEEIFKGRAEVKAVIYFECSTQTMESRVNARAETSNRAEDKPKHLKDRIDTFENDTKKIIKHFDDKGLVKKFNAERPSDQVYEDIKKILGAMLKGADSAKTSNANSAAHSKNESVASQPKANVEPIAVVAAEEHNEKSASPTVNHSHANSTQPNVVVELAEKRSATIIENSASPTVNHSHANSEVKPVEEQPKQEEKPKVEEPIVEMPKPEAEKMPDNLIKKRQANNEPESIEELPDGGME